MPIYTTEDKGLPGTLAEYNLPTIDALGISAQEAMSDNLITKGYDWVKLRTMDDQGRSMSKGAIDELAKQSGVSLKLDPETSLNKAQAEYLIERQYNKKLREEKLSMIEDSFSKSALSLTGGLLGSAVDPINIAASFIPVVGEARAAALMERLGASIVGRTAVRGAIGFAEGAVGAAALEPANYMLSQSLGDDYNMTNSLMNITYGGLLGGGLHMGAGAAKEAIAAGRAWFVKRPNGKIAGVVDSLGHEARVDLHETAVRQVLNDKPVDVEGLVKGYAEQRKPTTKELRESTAREIDSEVFQQFDTLKGEELKLKEAYKIADRLKEIDDAFKDPNITREEFDRLSLEEQEIMRKYPGQERTDIIASTKPGQKALKEIRKQLDILNERKSKAYRKADQQLKPKFDFDNAPEIETQGLSPIQEALSKRDSDLNVNEILSGSTISRDSAELIKRAAKAEPNSAHIDKATIEKYDQKIKEVPQEYKMDEVNMQLENEMLNLEQTAKQAGIENYKEFLKESLDNVKKADEYGSLLDNMANCRIKKG